MTICTYNARALASDASIEELMMQARKIKYSVIGLTETRRHRPLHAVFDTGEELSLGTCGSRGVGGVGVFVNTNLAMNIDSFEQLAPRIGRLRLMRRGSMPALAVFVVYAPTSDYDDEEVEAFYIKLIEVSREYVTLLCLTFIYVKILSELYKGFTTVIIPFYNNVRIKVKRGVRQERKLADFEHRLAAELDEDDVHEEWLCVVGSKVNMTNDLSKELGRRKRAAEGAFKNAREVVRKTNI
ncbi:unnamed protein product [Nippostrongylus brasiliensis]|uniref:Endo/exonuclease/phosphatase domain-containing protein n=1 Tax=Nippostrongylus brasiliensis TaxID=27835 RepID=A0A0N4YJ95_NIPBR|nr:unnamed protein product [Nippostrongylus brasiliensis]